MTFNSFNNAGAAGVSQGPALSEVETEGLGFLSLAGDAKLRLSTPWSPPPAANASLMSIASRRGLVAAAGPDAVILSSTDIVRKAFESPKDGDSDVRPFTPQLKLPFHMRISQLAFSANEAHLILSAEQGGGLAVYDVDALQQGLTEPTFQISTNGESLRALVPNPRPEKAELCAVVTIEGKLMMANLNKRSFMSGGSGQVMKDQVSCVTWSNKGKQLVVGLGDGNMCQLTPEGDIKAEIPRPPELDSTYYASTIVWLENDLFLVFHVSTSNGPESKCHMITRQNQSFQYQALNDPVDSYGAEKVPHHTAVRLKDFPPNLQDLLIFSSSAVPDIGLLARSKTPLAPDGPTNVFTNILLADDSKRATLPIGEDLENPSAIGASLDLSSKDKVYKPIPTDELDQSPGPLPGYWVLNDQGILSIWWIVYTESIHSGITYPDLIAAETGSTDSTSTVRLQTTQPSSFETPNALSFKSAPASTAPTFGGPSVPGTMSSPWGAASKLTSTTIGGTAFGSTPFGSSGTSETPKSVFGTSTFGTGNTSATAPAFGQATGLGARASPWASGTASSSTPAFGQSGFANAANMGSDLFGNRTSSSIPAASSFSSFAGQGGFAAVGSNASASADKTSIFASAKHNTSEASMDTKINTSFPPSTSKTDTGVGAPFGSQPFKLTSSFKPDSNIEKEDGSNTSMGAEKSIFGSGFTSSMNEATKTASNIFGGERQGLFGKPTSNTNVESTTPTTTPAANKFFSQPLSAPDSSGLFTLPSTSSGSLFGMTATKTPRIEAPQLQTTAPQGVPLPPESTNATDVKSAQSGAEDLPLPPDSPILTAKSTASVASTQKGTPLASTAPLPPLPPDPVKDRTAHSTPSARLYETDIESKIADNAPLPPDPIKNKKAYAAELPPLPGAVMEAKAANDTPLPPDPVKHPKAYENKLPALPIAKPPSAITGPGFKFPSNPRPVSDSDDDDDDDGEDDEATEAASEGSGVDVTKDLSPSSTGANRTPGFTPQSSFDGLAGSYSPISRPDPERRSFFGELGRNAPVFPQPNPVSPRSPSPVRGAVPPRILGNDQLRSFSAPGIASHILRGPRKPPRSHMGVSIVGRDAAIENTVMEQQRKAKARKEAEEAQVLVDEEDDAVQKLLSTEVEPTLDLDEFIAHSGVTPPASDSIPAQVEAVYHDINSMIDTLGLNARSLKAYIKGHKKFGSEHHSKQDLASPDVWTLGDIDQLACIIGQILENALDEARVIDVEEKVAQVQDILRELARDCNKQADLRKIVISRLDPEQAAAYQSFPLSAEQAAQQSDLRRQLGQFQSLLAQAEESLSLLKAKIVSANSFIGRGSPMPTIEAIVRTITKMTSMVEKRSGDIDVLENQMRKLRLGSTGPSGSREVSPFATPNAKKALGSSIFSPERSARQGSTPLRGSAMRHSLSGSITGMSEEIFRTPPRKKLSGFGNTEKRAVKEKRERRTAMTGKLRNSIQKRGPSVWAMDDVE